MADLQPYHFEPERVPNHQDSKSENEEANDRLKGTFWCSCERCEIMPMQRERVCCREQPEEENKIDGRILSLYFIGRTEWKNKFLCKLLSDIKRRFNKGVSSYFLPQLFVFCILLLLSRDRMHFRSRNFG